MRILEFKFKILNLKTLSAREVNNDYKVEYLTYDINKTMNPNCK